MRYRKPLQERFEALYIPEPNSGCWIWIGSITRLGYGRFCIVTSRPMLAHRASWLIYEGFLPPEPYKICHKCDMRWCVNPEHLYVGNHQSNMDDMIKRGRSARGRCKAKITEEQARRIKYGNESAKLLAKEFKISKTTIWHIRAGIRWSYI